MSRRSFPPAILPCFVLIASLVPPDLQVAADDRELAKQLVAEALQREIHGLQSDRGRLLAEAEAADPNYAPARWHQGFVRVGGGWSDVYDAPGIIGKSPKLAIYRRRREEHGDTLVDHLRLANWCRDRRLPDQERAHLTRILDFNPNHVDARRRLGFQLWNGRWIETAAIQHHAEQRASRQEALEEWRDAMLDLRDSLRKSNPERRKLAAERIRAITSADAIPAFEAILSPDSQVAAKLALEAIAGMPQQAAVESLIRHAVFSPWPEVRDEASRLLKSRPLESFVPILLAEMYAPVESRTAVAPANGRLVYQHTFAREGQDQRQVLALNSVYRRRAVPGGDGGETSLRVFADAFAMAVRLEQYTQQQNDWTRVFNERVTRVLNIATQQNLPPVPQSWWQWWNQQNDVVLYGQKPTQALQRTRQVVVQDQAPAQGQQPTRQPVVQAPARRKSTNVETRRVVSPLQLRGECFAAGTPVWTASGILPIETIRVGDVVLSQDVETGELAYKPVLRTSIRPPERLVKIRVGTESFETSGGHLFWVSGQGWSKARELDSEHSLHAIDGSFAVTAIEDGTEAQTFNLVVADYNTYVVGTSKILSHDVTDRRPTRMTVPGLLAY